MKLTIGTARLQALLNKAVKGASCNKLITKTGLIAIKLQGGVLTLTTTDDTNYLSMVERDVAGDDFYVAVQVDLLSKLVSKMTCENVTLEVTDSSLEVIGNGKYNIELDLEDDGSLVKLPNPIEKFEKTEKFGTASPQTIMSVLTSVKHALATSSDDEFPWLTCYYVGDSVTATDTYTIADYKNGFLKEPKLIGAVTMDLLGLLNGEISVYVNGDKVLFEADNGLVYSVIPSGVEHYSVEDVKALVSQGFTYSCKVVKSALLNLLDRIALFAGEYDNGKITLSFSKDGLEVGSKYATETVVYTDSSNAGEFKCFTDVNTFVTQVKAQSGSEITIEYGEDNAIKIIDGDVTSVIALLEED